MRMDREQEVCNIATAREARNGRIVDIVFVASVGTALAIILIQGFTMIQGIAMLQESL